MKRYRKKGALFILGCFCIAMLFINLKSYEHIPAKETQTSSLSEVINNRNLRFDIEPDYQDSEIKRYGMETTLNGEPYYTYNETVKSILDNYNCVVMNAKYLYEPMDYRYCITNYTVILVKSKSFNVKGNTSFGYVLFKDGFVFVAEDDEPWLNTKLTLTEKYLIHEIAHAAYGYADHDSSWMDDVRRMVSHLYDDEETVAKLVDDIVKPYGLTLR